MMTRLHSASAFHLCWCGLVHSPEVEEQVMRTLWRREYRGMLVRDAFKNLMLDAIQETLSTGVDWTGLHSAYSATGGYEYGGAIGTPTALSEAGSDVTVTLANSLQVGQAVVMAGNTPGGYNGTFTVTSVVPANSPGAQTGFHYTNGTTGLGAGSAFGASSLPAGSYVRVATVWNAAGAAVAGRVDLGGTLPQWQVPANQPIQYWSGWDANTGGNHLFSQPVGGQAMQVATMESAGDISTNNIVIRAHGLSADNRVVIWPIAGLALPAATPALLQGVVYYVGSVVDSNTITLSTLALNANPVDVTGTQPFAFLIQRVIPEFYASAGAYGLVSGFVDANLLS